MRSSKPILYFLILWAAVLAMVGCSTTSHLPEGEVLYAGVAKIDHIQPDTTDAAVRAALAEVFEVTPNGSLLGSAYYTSPMPMGLWIYNGLYPRREKGFRHWLWKRFKSNPILVSGVNPGLRTQAAEAILKDHGYFDAVVTHDTLYRGDDRRRAKIAYQVRYPRQSRLTSVSYLPNRRSPGIDSIVTHTLSASRLRVGDGFSTEALQAERDRLVSTMRDSGYYFYSADQIRFTADSTLSPHGIALRIMTGIDTDEDSRSLRPCTIDSMHVELDWGAGLHAQKGDTLGRFSVGYYGAQGIKTRHLRRCFPFWRDRLYSPERMDRVPTLLARLNTFKYTQTTLSVIEPMEEEADEPDSVRIDLSADTLSLRLRTLATYASPWTGKLSASIIYKDNDQLGPGLRFTTQRRNLFHGGELLSAELIANYEWDLGDRRVANRGSVANSFEFGGRVSLTVPRLQLPRRWIHTDRRNPVSTRYGVSASFMSRSGFFRIFKASGEVTYSFYTSTRSSHSFTPLSLTYSRLLHTTSTFDSIRTTNKALLRSFEDQLIPKMQYTYTYDNTSTLSTRRSGQSLQIQLSEAGLLCDGMMGWVGSRPKGSRRLLWLPYSQFVKGVIEYRHYQRLSPSVQLAMRALGGVAYAYGNSKSVPYSEQFYVGGPNSLRGFSVRGVGPGTTTLYSNLDYGYLYRVGDYKLELNAELRFPLSGDLKGVLFADAGNVWQFGGDSRRVRLFSEMALDAGFGFRYDLGILVVRFDIGVPLHDPNIEDRSYFNCRHGVMRKLGYNLAVGYPF